MRSLAFAAVAATLTLSSAISAPPTSTVTIDKARIDRSLQDMVSSGRAAGASALVWKDGKEAYFGTAGYADREAKRPFSRDTLVQIFSMTKPVSGVAFMQLWEQGKFGLDDPLSMYLPEFANAKVFVGKDTAGNPILVAPRRPILIRDIVRHTAGFGYGPGPTYPEEAFAKADPLNLANDLPEFGRRLATVPLLYEPGTKWRYSAGVDVQALLVQKLSGQPYEEYVRQHIFEPLGMKETGWTQPESILPRLAAGYAKGPDGTLQRKSEADFRHMNFNPERKLTMGGAGLISSVDDFMRFARMLVNGGTLDGVRILKPSTVRMMATNELDARVTDRQWLPDKGNGGFGIDFAVRTGQPKDTQENRGAVGEFFWDGAWSTLFWVDPANKLTAVFFVQKDPFDRSLHRDIRRAIYGDDYLGPTGD
ncbi:serine hydrolase domain-containing protein [Sphingomonas daechungensis]|uniref:Beta-lactamase family protein n=1 Tax=Sphingomonas daechungensis TaxID=1176646 RepID=A0ABX6SZ58_9SPHN|nr:serine hydrolase domain-containing protein [Sphingomonas daechungensis]QNP42725.1 beta-lactamase family protein [Sphingomonas daechungensis]